MDGKTRKATAREMGINFIPVERTNDLNDSIETTRRLLARCWFDEGRGNMEKFISAIASYHRKWDSVRECYMDKPEHDWASNFADALRQMAQAWNDRLALKINKYREPAVAKTEFNIF